MKLTSNLKKLSYSQFVKIKGKWVQKPTYLISKEYAYQIIGVDLKRELIWEVRKFNRQTKEPLNSFKISDRDLERNILTKQVQILTYDSDR